jgi:hypothetical protein
MQAVNIKAQQQRNGRDVTSRDIRQGLAIIKKLTTLAREKGALVEDQHILPALVGTGAGE